MRDINEGETPFLFDSLYNLGNVVRLDANLQLDPAPWLSFSSRGGYVFVFENRPDGDRLGTPHHRPHLVRQHKLVQRHLSKHLRLS